MKLNSKSINNILFYAICATLFVIITVSISAFFVRAKKDSKAERQKQIQVQQRTETPSAFYTEFGRLRSFTNDSQKIPVIMTPVLKYKENNTPLYEEICLKKAKLQNCITSYFNDKKNYLLFVIEVYVKQFNQIGEENAKKQILNKINENLSMGQIEEIYFDELIFLE